MKKGKKGDKLAIYLKGRDWGVIMNTLAPGRVFPAPKDHDRSTLSYYIWSKIKDAYKRGTAELSYEESILDEEKGE
jgi:hypothetical protein